MDQINNFIFSPQMCNRGRLWRGKLAYYLGKEKTNKYGDIICRLYEPNKKQYVYANSNFLETACIEREHVDLHKSEYLKWVVYNATEGCKLAKPWLNEHELKRFVRNTLLKQYPELYEHIEIIMPNECDVATEIEKSLQWALALKTRPTFLYGKWRGGGKPFPVNTIVSIAYKALVKKGITLSKDFDLAWKFMLNQYNLPQIVE